MRLYHFLIIIVALTAFVNLPIASGNDMQITASLGLQTEYNDNIFFSDTDELDDVILTFSPGLRYSRENTRLNMELAGRIDSIHYSDNDELNDNDQNIRTAIRYRLHPRMRFSGEFDYLRDSRPDRDIETTGLLLSSNIRYSRYLTLSESYDHSENTVSSLTYTFQDQDFEDPQLVDFDTHIARLSVSHNIHRYLPMTRARFNLGYIRYDYPELNVNYYSTTLGATHDITELSALLVDLGTTHSRKEIDSDTPSTVPFEDSERESGFTGQISLSHQGESTRSLLSVSHELSAASGRSAITERTSLIGDVSRKLTAEIKGSLKARYYINRADRGDLATEDIDTRTLSVIPAITFRFTNDIFLEIFYNYSIIEDRQADSYAYRNLLFMRLVGEYPFFE